MENPKACRDKDLFRMEKSDNWNEYFNSIIPGYLKSGCFEFGRWVIIKNNVYESLEGSVFEEQLSLIATDYFDDKIITSFSNKNDKYVIKSIGNWLTNKEIVRAIN